MVEHSSLASWQKGQIARVKVELRAMDKVATVRIPTNPDCRYDMIVDWCGKLYRAQIKYAGGVSAKAKGIAIVNLTKGERGERRYTSDEIDVLLVYVPVKDLVCWFGPEIFHGKTKLHIRHTPCSTNQRKGCILIEDHAW